MLRTVRGLLALCLGAAVPAGAATLVSATPGAPDPGDTGALVLDFEGALPSGISFAAGSEYSILQGTVPHRGFSPAGDETHYLAVPGAGTSGTAVIDFSGYTGPRLRGFSLYWGSIDRANSLTIVTSFGSFTTMGSDLINRAFGSAVSATANRRVFFGLSDTEILRSLRLTSPTAFEVDDIVFQTDSRVPEPASWALLVSGFATVGTVARRRRVAAA